MVSFIGELSLTTFVPSNLYLDPNNPRFYDLGIRPNVPDERICDTEVQEEATRNMRRDNFNVIHLKDSISEVGFLPIDKMVVREIEGEEDKYVVVEGNRRLAAIKWILEDVRNNELTLSEEILETLQNIEVIVISGSGFSAEAGRWMIQGIRHISGIQRWGLYQQAVAIKTMLEDLGKTPQEVGRTLGVHVGRVNRLHNALDALEQMSANEDFGRFARPTIFSYFEETIKKPILREFLGWNSETRTFTENAEEFYSWITPDEAGVRKIPEALAIRDFAKVIENEEALSAFRDPATTLSRALSIAMPPRAGEWRHIVRVAKDAINNMTVPDLEHLTQEDQALLTELAELIQRRMDQAARLS